ncbi:MAG: hypothetical protein OEN20_03595 [Gammaproteobacteria bacterium]|nr:hypothetical protein [Gammaproteobacteria bacterium]
MGGTVDMLEPVRKKRFPIISSLVTSLALCTTLGACVTTSSGGGSDDSAPGNPPLNPPGGRPSEPQALDGEVDSSLVDRTGENRIYAYEGIVTPDDYDGDQGDPVASALVGLDFGACTWYYGFPNLAAGTYTIAFTNAAQNDDPGTDDALAFVGTTTVNVVDNQTTSENFAALNVLRVGPGRLFETPTQAQAVVSEGDVIEIDAGVYDDDITQWRTDDITLRGVGGYAHMRATRLIPFDNTDAGNGKGIWVTLGNNITIENIEFSGARVADLNGAGIRAEGNNLSVCNAYFHDNENGILGAANGTMEIEYSEFRNNGRCGGGAGCAHNLYIVDGDTLMFRHNYSHHANIGHNLKTRATKSYILYNRIMDETDGTASYAIDIPDGGLAYVIGNLLQQGPNTDNSGALVTFGVESLPGDRTHALYMINNTLVNDFPGGGFVNGEGGAQTLAIVNNIFAGGGGVPSGPGVMNNLISNSPGLVDIAGFDYRLTENSPARDAGIDPGIGMGFDLMPVYQYVHAHTVENRPLDATPDIGAYEYSD